MLNSKCIVCGKDCYPERYFCGSECRFKFLTNNYTTKEMTLVVNGTLSKSKEELVKEKSKMSVIFDRMRERAKVNQLEKDVKLQAKAEAIKESKQELVNQYKTEMLSDKPKTSPFGKVASNLFKGFQDSNIGSTDKINQMLGGKQ